MVRPSAHVVLTVVFLVAFVHLVDSQVCPDALPSLISDIWSRHGLERSSAGVFVVRADAPGSIVYESRAYSMATPASNNKVLTTSAAFLQLGPAATWNTAVKGVNGSAVQAELCVQGVGDPTWTPDTLADVASSLAAQGVQRVHSLALDTTAYRGPAFPDSWEWSDLSYYYGAQPAALNVAENVVTFVVSPGAAAGAPVRISGMQPADAVSVDVEAVTGAAGSGNSVTVGYSLTHGTALLVSGSLGLGSAPITVQRSVLNPLHAVGTAMRHALVGAGIDAASASVSVQPCNASHTLHTVTSEPVSTTMKHCLLVSDNLYAESFQKWLGVVKPLSSSATTYESGLAAVASTLTAEGVNATSFVQADGSGLSRHNLVSPQAMVDTFAVMRKHADYMSYLPVAGESGTLANRFIGTPAAGITHAKTGTMSGVNALSGVVEHPPYPTIFSIIVNGSAQSSATVRQAIDAIVVLLAQLQHC